MSKVSETTIKCIFFAVGGVYLSQFVFILTIISNNLLFNNDSDFSTTILNVLLPVLLAFVIPSIIYYYISHRKDRVIELRFIAHHAIHSLIIFSLIAFYFYSESNQLYLLATFSIAFGEELFFRGAVQNLLASQMSFRIALLVQSMLFTFVNHSASSVLENLTWLLIPTILLTLIAERYGLKYSIAIHWLYNLTLML